MTTKKCDIRIELCSEIDHLKDTVTALKQAAKNKGAK